MAIPLISVSCVPSCCAVKRPPASIGGTAIPITQVDTGFHPAPVTLSGRCGPSGIMTPVEGPITMQATSGLMLNQPGPVGLPEVNPDGSPIQGGFGSRQNFLGGPCRLDVPASSCIVPVNIKSTQAPEPPTTAVRSDTASAAQGQVPGAAATNDCSGNAALGFLVIAALAVGIYFLSKA